MKKTWLFASFILISFCSFAENADSLKTLYAAEKNDTGRFVLCQLIVDAYQEKNPEAGFPYAHTMVKIADDLNWPMGKAIAANTVGYLSSLTGNYAVALESLFKGIAVAERLSVNKKDRSAVWLKRLAYSFKSEDVNQYRYFIHYDLLHNLGNLYENLNSYDLQLEAFLKARDVLTESDLAYEKFEIQQGMGRSHYLKGNYDNALIELNKAKEQSEKITYRKFIAYLYRDLGFVYMKLKNFPLAMQNFRTGMNEANASDNPRALIGPANGLAYTYFLSGVYDSAIHFAHFARKLSNDIGIPRHVMGADTLLALIHKARENTDSAYYFLSEANGLKDRLMNGEKMKQLQMISEQDKKRKQDIEAEKQASENRMKLYGLLALLFFFTVFSVILLKNNRQRRKAHTALEKQKSEVESALQKLKIAQTQLVQQEKLASLGELTAGIAHEIQNPLNFINNFSEVNAEMAGELKDEISVAHLPESERQSIFLLADNILQNQEKIVHHGKRADSIVKGMLQHSRTTTGKKEPVDINNLADEYLRLSYHGLRAKDKTFNAEMVTDYDKAVGLIPVLPQDLGRVFLNLFTNAFYSVSAKKKIAGSAYKPIVTVNTKRTAGTVEILITDNGTGIPQPILDKIFQPFFTTKPTGEGTGLGLSLSYDIITKGHDGRLEVDSKDGEYARFNIIIPA